MLILYFLAFCLGSQLSELTRRLVHCAICEIVTVEQFVGPCGTC